MKYFVYKITNIINGKSYIGFTSKNPPEKRWKEHVCSQSRYPINKALKKYSKENFEFTILSLNYNYNKALKEEIKFISKYNTIVPNGYNVTIGGEGVTGIKKTIKQRKVHSQYMKNFYKEEENRKRMSQKIKDLYKDPIFRDKMKDVHKKSHNNEEYKRKCSKNFKKLWKNQEYRKKTLEARKITQRTIEYREKHSRIQKERYKNPEVKNKQIDAVCRYIYEIKFPNNKIKTVKNLREFCRKNNIPHSSLYSAMKEKREYKKYFVRIIKKI